MAPQWGRNGHAHVWQPGHLLFLSLGLHLLQQRLSLRDHIHSGPNSTGVPVTVWSFLCRLVASAPLPSIDGAAGCPVMSTDHPSMQQAFHVLKDHAEAVECLQAQLKRCGWSPLHSVTDGLLGVSMHGAGGGM